MHTFLERLLRTVDPPDAERAEVLWAEYRTGGTDANAAFATLLAWYGNSLYRRIWGFVRSDAAEDVFQDVLAKLHRERANLATFAHALRWLRTVAVTQSVDAHRRVTRRRARDRRAARPESDAPADRPDELQEAIRAGLAKLPAAEREAVALVFFEGLTRQDAAAVAGVHRDTLAARLDAALKRLQQLVPAPAVAGGVVALPTALSAHPPGLPPARLGELVTRAWAAGTGRGVTKTLVAVGLVVCCGTAVGWVASRQPRPADPPPQAAVPAEPETLQAQNLRILEAQVLPRVVAGLEKFLGAPVRVTEVRAEGAEVVVHVAGTRPWFGGTSPPKFRARYDTVTRGLTSMADLGGDGEWRHVGTRNKGTVRTLGREVEFYMDVSALGIREAFALLPRDERGPALARLRLAGTPYGGPELLVPHDSASIAGNSRHLYMSTWGYILARDDRREFEGWRWVGQTAGSWVLAADDDYLFGASIAGPLTGPVQPRDGAWRLYARPATVAPAEWVLLGPMPPGFYASPLPAGFADWRFGFAAAGGWVFAESTGESLVARPATAGPADWQPAGRRPGGAGKLLGCRDRLYFLGDDGRLWDRPASPLAADWGVLGGVGAFKTATGWADRLVCWNPPSDGDTRVLARPLRPALGDWTTIGRVDTAESFLGHRW